MVDINEDLFIEGTKSSPKIHFKPDGNCIITGNAMPYDLEDIYKRAKLYLKELIKNDISINFTFNYTFFNTLMQGYNYSLLEELDTQETKGTVTWNYSSDDEDIEDMGEMYKKAFIDLHIKLKKI